MGKLIVVVGNSGVGKTTFSRRLSQAGPFILGLEQQQERPFQLAFSKNRSNHGLQNQIDYLLLRARQELSIRKQEKPGIQDGGLEMDFFVFTRLFYLRGYLSEAEYLCVSDFTRSSARPCRPLTSSCDWLRRWTSSPAATLAATAAWKSPDWVI